MRSHLLHARCRWSVLSCLLLCLLFVSSCVAPVTQNPPFQDPPLPPTPTLIPGESIPFEAVARGATGGAGCGADNFPNDVALIATTTEQFAQMWASLRSTSDEAKPDVDFAHNAVLAVVEGCSSECRDLIEVTNLIRSPKGSLIVYAKRRLYTAEYGCAAAEASSYNIVRVLKNAIPTAETEVSLIVYEAYQ